MLARIASRCGGPLRDRVSAFGSLARTMTAPGGEQLPVRGLAEISPEDVDGAHVIHLAYLTREKAQDLGERVFAETNLAIDDAVLAAIEGAAPASLFVASSGAAAQAAQGRDLHPYGMAKLRQEARFLDWGARAGVPVLAGRIFNVAGPYANKLQSYALSNFALQAMERGAIHIEAQVPVFRSYLHVADLCDLAIGAALRNVGRERAIDLCGAEVVEMDDLARAVAAACRVEPSISRGPVDLARPSVYVGDHTETKVLAMELEELLSPLGIQVADTMAWLSDAGDAPDRRKSLNVR
jgi:nucleoside-diphosphate-sugar epimerase